MLRVLRSRLRPFVDDGQATSPPSLTNKESECVTWFPGRGQRCDGRDEQIPAFMTSALHFALTERSNKSQTEEPQEFVLLRTNIYNAKFH